MKQALYGYTDYPILALGDESGKPAPIRKCRAITYDRTKMVEIIVGEDTHDYIKAGYFYKKPGRLTPENFPPTFSYKELCQLPNETWDD